MNKNSFSTKSAKPAEIERSWLVIDGENAVVGRLASAVAQRLRGKHRPDYTPHVDMGDHIVVVNAEKVRFTGSKETDKSYFRHTGYPGGARFSTPKEKREKDPEFIVRNAVKGMLPKTKLGRQMFKRLRVYSGAEHPHEAQEPSTLELS